MPTLNSTHWYWPFQSCPSNSGWHQLTTAQLTDAESAADKVLAPTAAGGAAPARLTAAVQRHHRLHLPGRLR